MQTLPDARVQRAQPWLGTLVEIAFDAPKGQTIADPFVSKAFDAAFAAIKHVHQRMSFHEPDSDLHRLALCKAGDTVMVSMETATVIRAAQALHAQSGGLFDAAVGQTLVASGVLPCPEGVDPRGHIGDMNDVVWLDAHTARIERPTLLDLGGIAKGYAVDQAVAALTSCGVSSGIVCAGGDLRLFGAEPQPVHVRHADGRIASMGMHTNTAIASSENVRTRFKHHGAWVTPHMAADGQSMCLDEVITVQANTCMMADAMTKVAMQDAFLANTILNAYDGRVLHAPQHHIAA